MSFFRRCFSSQTISRVHSLGKKPGPIKWKSPFLIFQPACLLVVTFLHSYCFLVFVLFPFYFHCLILCTSDCLFYIRVTALICIFLFVYDPSECLIFRFSAGSDNRLWIYLFWGKRLTVVILKPHFQLHPETIENNFDPLKFCRSVLCLNRNWLYCPCYIFKCTTTLLQDEFGLFSHTTYCFLSISGNK